MKNRLGQSLIEVTVAVAIIITGIISTITLVNVMLKTSTSGSDQLQAQYLAWDAIEAVQNIRDTNFLNDLAFDTNILDGTTILIFQNLDDQLFAAIPPRPWFFDYSVDDISDSSARVYFDGVNYTQRSAQQKGDEVTKFRRLLSITKDIPSGTFTVVATVEWDDRGQTRSTTAERTFYDWQ